MTAAKRTPAVKGESLRRVAELAKDGLTQAEIAAKTGLTRQRVSQLAQQLPKMPLKAADFMPVRVGELTTLADEGGTFDDAGAKYGVDPMTVRRWVRDYAPALRQRFAANAVAKRDAERGVDRKLAALRRCAKDGMTLRAAAAEVGVSYTTACRWVRERLPGVVFQRKHTRRAD